MSARRHVFVLGAAFVVLGALLLAEQAWIGGKGLLAEWLIERAFVAHLDDGEPHRPWAWADTHPVARLSVPRLGIRRTILAGAAGSSLAFGPGHVDGTAPPNREGNCVLAGHRDSWFAFLEKLHEGDDLILETRNGERRYRVVATAVRSMWDERVAAETSTRRLTLVTCYPFDGLLGSDQRYVVVAEPVPLPEEAV